MKTTRQAKILELIQRKDVETQEELSAYLEKEGFQVTQATVSRDIRELKLTKISTDNGRQKYAVITDADSNMMEKYAMVLREGFCRSRWYFVPVQSAHGLPRADAPVCPRQN